MSLNEEMESYFYSPFVLNMMPVNDASQPLSSMRTQFQATESLNALDLLRKSLLQVHPVYQCSD
jgi:hypothetical protein